MLSWCFARVATSLPSPRWRKPQDSSFKEWYFHPLRNSWSATQYTTLSLIQNQLMTGESILWRPYNMDESSKACQTSKNQGKDDQILDHKRCTVLIIGWQHVAHMKCMIAKTTGDEWSAWKNLRSSSNWSKPPDATEKNRVLLANNDRWLISFAQRC